MITVGKLAIAAAACATWVLASAGDVHAIGLNPANPGLPAVDNVYGLSGVPGRAASAICVACHTSVPVFARSSHFSYQSGRSTPQAIQQVTEKFTQWDGSDGFSKYGAFGPAASVVGSRGELICESCHNLVLNVAGGNHLLEAPALLCDGCHTNLPGHHPMTGDPVSGGGVLSNADSPFTRGFTDNLTQLGGTSSEVRYPGPNQVNCLSCHADGHNGYQNTGARFLRRGFAGASSIAPISPGSAVVGTATDGAQRQFDKDSSGVVRLISNWQPLCDACHKVDD